MLTGVFIGTVGVVILDGADVSSPFTSIMEAMMDEGGFAKGIGIIAVTASLAAIMSTADSLVIAISQLVTVEIVYPMRPKMTPKGIAWVGRAVSLISTTVALLIGILWKDGVASMGAIQFPISMQAVPAFVIGMYGWNDRTDIHPWSIAFSAVASTVYVLAIYFSYLTKAFEPLPINAGITGFTLQIGVIVVLELARRLLGLSKRSSKVQVGNADDITHGTDGGTATDHFLLFPDRPKWDVPKLARFGEHALSPQMIWKSMEDVNEPLSNPWWALLMFIAISMLTPLTPEHQPPLDPATSSFYSFAPPPVVNGIPWWAFKIIIGSIVPFAILMVAVANMPNTFTFDAKKIEEEGIDPDLVELTYHEKNRRTSYDERNVFVYRRRSTISKTMEDFKLAADLVKVKEDEKLADSRRRMSALVMAKPVEEEKPADIKEETI